MQQSLGLDEIEEFELEVRDNFLRLGESKLQDRYANYLLDRYEVIASLYERVCTYNKSVFDVYNPMSMVHMGRKDRTEEQYRAIIEGSTVSNLEDQVGYWKETVEENLRLFTPEIHRQINSGLIDQTPEPMWPGKSSKKENPTGWKHQLIMMDELELLDAGKLGRLNDLQKAKVLALLLNRNVQDIRTLLGNWKGRKDPAKLNAKYLIKEHHEEVVKDWLLDLGIVF